RRDDMSFWKKTRSSRPAPAELEVGRVQKRRRSVRRSAPVAMEVKILAIEALESGPCAKDDGNEHIYPFIVIGVETSMRLMEILSIRKEHVDVQRRVIYIPKGKTGAREQPITAYLAEFLKGYIIALPSRPGSFPHQRRKGATR
ncbi:MAG: tyrosine-type recombinase/integrase, partial [Candidatus Binatia bacterium]